jgi:hypothetical protein
LGTGLKNPFFVSNLLASIIYSTMNSWQAAYAVLIVVLLLYIVKYEYERYYHEERLRLGREAQQASAHAMLIAESSQHPDAPELARAVSVAANQAGTAETYQDAVHYHGLTQQFAQVILDLPN